VESRDFPGYRIQNLKFVFWIVQSGIQYILDCTIHNANFVFWIIESRMDNFGTFESMRVQEEVFIILRYVGYV